MLSPGVNEGIYRILRTLGDGQRRERSTLARESGEAPTVLDDALTRHPAFFAVEAREVVLTQAGLAALAREMVARAVDRPRHGVSDEVAERWRRLAAQRGTPRRELDQVYATEATVLARVERLIVEGEVQRGLAFLGDDDLTSAALHFAGVDRAITVVDIDDAILGLLDAEARSIEAEARCIHHDLRDPLPRKLHGRFGCVFTDPPYAPEGFALFVSRAIDLLKADGRLYVCFGSSRRSSERGLEKQRLLTTAGLLVEAVLPDFNAYEGADAIGARSDLWVLRRTPKTRPLVQGRVEGELYSSRSPAGARDAEDAPPSRE